MLLCNIICSLLNPSDVWELLWIAHDGRYRTVHTTTIRIREKYICMARNQHWTDVRREQACERMYNEVKMMAMSIDVQQEGVRESIYMVKGTRMYSEREADRVCGLGIATIG